MEEILSSAELRSLVRGGNNVLPVAIRFPTAGAEEDSGAFAVFRAILRRDPDAVFFEGVEPTGRRGRYSWIGLRPLKRWWIQDGRLNSLAQAQPLRALDRELRAFRGPKLDGFPSFYAGATGYLGYDCVRYLEPKLGRGRGEHPIPHPEALLQIHETWIIFDHARAETWVVSSAYLAMEKLARGLARARRANARAVAMLRRSRASSARKPAPARPGAPARLPERKAFAESVRALQRHIRAGDIFQCVLSHPFWAHSRRRPLDLYAELRGRNPSPYMFYLPLPGQAVAFGASPERLVKVEGGIAETHPIAGTRPRGRDERDDARLAKNLLQSSKERAEHMMLVDLGRNDLGKVCAPGTVGVSGFMRVERFSHVMHLVSTVRGRLRAGVSPFQALLACFPAGTLSGAPKFRAMELIQAHERGPRGLYGGAILQIGFDGYLDSCIAIRSALAHRGTICIQAGAGVVFDSRAAAEYDETLHKSRVLRGGLPVNSRPDVLLIDNYDSFTYNLYQALELLGYRTLVVRNDRVRASEIPGIRPRCLVISPGPGTPDDSGVTLAAIQAMSGKIPLLGVCLGHQALGQAFGGRVVRAPRPIHGKSCPIYHAGRDLFAGLESPVEVMRYHSLVLEAKTLPRALKVTSRTRDGLVMSVRHARHPSWGVQFHPESIGTPEGPRLLRNFFRHAGLAPSRGGSR